MSFDEKCLPSFDFSLMLMSNIYVSRLNISVKQSLVLFVRTKFDHPSLSFFYLAVYNSISLSNLPYKGIESPRKAFSVISVRIKI